MSDVTFTAKLTFRKYIYTGFTPSEMLGVGQVAVAANFKRWDAGQNVQDLPAKPLASKYAGFKAKIGKNPIRDLRLSGALRAAIQPLSADQTKVVVGAPDGAMHPSGMRRRRLKGGGNVQGKRLLFVNEVLSFNIARERQFGVSPSDERAVIDRIRSLVESKQRVIPGTVWGAPEIRGSNGR